MYTFKQYTKGLKVQVSFIKFNNSMEFYHSVYYHANTIIIHDKSLFSEHTSDWKLYNSFSKEEKKKIISLITSSHNDYGLENLINIILHEVGHHVNHNNLVTDKERKNFEKKSNTTTISKYTDYFNKPEEDERDDFMYRAKQNMKDRRLYSETFAENFRLKMLKYFKGL